MESAPAKEERSFEEKMFPSKISRETARIQKLRHIVFNLNTFAPLIFMFDNSKLSLRYFYNFSREGILQQVGQKIDLAEFKFQSALNSWNQFFSEILPESYSTSELNCLLNTKIKCEVSIDGKNIDLNLIQLNSFVIKNIKQVSEQFYNQDPRFYESYNELVTRLESSLKEINKKWKEIAAGPDTLIIKEEKRLAKTLIDIFSKVLKKIKADFGPAYSSPNILIDNIKKYVGPGNYFGLSLLDSIRISRGKLLSNLEGHTIGELKKLETAINFYLAKSGSTKLPNLYEKTLSKLYSLESLKSKILASSNLIENAQRDRDGGLEVFNMQSQALKKIFVESPRTEINKVVTFYSEDQRNAKKLLLELVDNYELVIAAAVQKLADYYNIRLPEKDKTFFEKAKQKAANAKAELSANAAKLKRENSFAASEWKIIASNLLERMKAKVAGVRKGGAPLVDDEPEDSSIVDDLY